MEQMTLLYIIAAFVVICALALTMQAASAFGTYKVAKALNDKIQPLLPKADALLESTRLTVDQGRQQIGLISARANDILDSTKVQLAKMDDVVADASTRAKVQMQRVELVLDDTMSKAHETVALVHGGIVGPLREINGITAGVKAAINHLARGANPIPSHPGGDEEMFI